MKIHAKIQKWGNSLGLRISGAMKTIPKFEENMQVTVDVTEKGIYVYPKPKKLTARDILPFTLEELLADVDEETVRSYHDLLPKRLPKEYGV